MPPPMEDAEVLKLYDPSPIPCLYVAPVANVLGRVTISKLPLVVLVVLVVLGSIGLM